MLCGAETWTLQRNEQKRLEAFEMWIWRRMKRVNWTDKIKNIVVLERFGEGRTMLELIKKRKRSWLGHLLRMLSTPYAGPKHVCVPNHTGPDLHRTLCKRGLCHSLRHSAVSGPTLALVVPGKRGLLQSHAVLIHSLSLSVPAISLFPYKKTISTQSMS